MNHPDVNELKQKHICAMCIGDKYLRDKVSEDYEKAICTYCGEKENSISIDDLSIFIEVAFEKHYSRTASEPDGMQWAMQKDKEIDYSWERDGEPSIYAIMNAANIPEDAASGIQSILSEKHFDFEEATMGIEGAFSDDAYYEEIMPGDHEWEEGWQAFDKSVKSEARFFSRVAMDQLDKLFSQINDIRTSSGASLIVDVGPESKLKSIYRARVFQSDQELIPAMKRPDLELSPPPSHLATAGRMNAKGISAFYGASSIETALAEVRPPVGSQVAVAEFRIIRRLRLLDLTKLEDIRVIGSIFDPEHAYRLGHK